MAKQKIEKPYEPKLTPEELDRRFAMMWAYVYGDGHAVQTAIRDIENLEQSRDAAQEQIDKLTIRLGQLVKAHNQLIASHDSVLQECGELAQRVLRLELAATVGEEPGWFDKFTGRN